MYNGTKFRAGTPEREVYDTLFPRFQNLLGPGLFKEIIEAVLREGKQDLSSMAEELESSEGETERLRNVIKNLSSRISELEEAISDVGLTATSIKKYANDTVEE